MDEMPSGFLTLMLFFHFLAAPFPQALSNSLGVILSPCSDTIILSFTKKEAGNLLHETGISVGSSGGGPGTEGQVGLSPLRMVNNV